MDEVIRLKVPSELKQWLQTRATGELSDMSTIIRRLLLEYKAKCDAQEPRPAINVVDYLTDASCTTTLELDK